MAKSWGNRGEDKFTRSAKKNSNKPSKGKRGQWRNDDDNYASKYSSDQQPASLDRDAEGDQD